MSSRRNPKGSITIFAAMSIMLIAAFLFSLLEAARIVEMKKIAEMHTDSVLESVFAAYQVPMWENYRLLLADAGEDGSVTFAKQEALIQSLTAETFESASFLRMEMTELQFPEYRLITDGNGTAFIAAAASYMKQNFPVIYAKQIYGDYESLHTLENLQEDQGDAWEDSLAALETLEEERKQSSAQEPQPDAAVSDSVKRDIKIKENPIETVKKAKKSGLLNLVIKSESEVSDNAVVPHELVSGRKLQEGTAKTDLTTSWMDRVCLQQYLVTHFSNYTNRLDGRALQYELEYLLCGKSSDTANLEGTVLRLLGIREAANFLYLMTDTLRQSEAMAIATVIAGVTVNPAIIEAVKLGILAAWAFVESVLDVRALLDGDSIALLKSPELWTSDLYHLPAVFSSFQKAKSCSWGLDYRSYAGALLFAGNPSVLAYRAMDMQEASVRLLEGYEDFQMDHMVVDAAISAKYRTHSIFLGMEQITAGMGSYFEISADSRYSYRKAGA